MKVRCNLCGKIFSSEAEYLDWNHDKRVHAYAYMQSYAEPLMAMPNKVNIVKDESAVR